MDRPLVTRLEIPIDPAEASHHCPPARLWQARCCSLSHLAAGAFAWRRAQQARGRSSKAAAARGSLPHSARTQPHLLLGGQRVGEGRPVTILFNALRCDERPAVGSCGGRGTAS